MFVPFVVLWILGDAHRLNETKMSDGGRDRASLGVEVWKSS